jgi:hypothetical protein
MDEILTPDQWFELQSRIRKNYPELKDADLQYHEASEFDLLAMVEYSILKTREIMHGIIAKRQRLFPLEYYWRYKRHSHISKSIL